MKKVLLSALALALLYGCASQPTEPEKPSVAPAPSPVTTSPVQTPASSSVPSKRSVFYDYDKSDIKDEYRPMLQAHVMGATDSQVEAVSLGEEKPRCTDHNEGCWSQNRRGDMLYGGEY